MARGRGGTNEQLRFVDGGWAMRIDGDDPTREGWAATMMALSNGAIGVRGVIEERAHATTFLAHAYEQSPIHYHERLHGFADRTDSRVPVVETLGLELRADGVPIDLAHATAMTQRTLDLRRGMMRRETRWTLEDGRELVVRAERLVPLDGRTVVIRRLAVDMTDAVVTMHPLLAPAPAQATQSDDPRMGVTLSTGGFATERAERDLIVERLAGSGIAVAAVQRVRSDGDWTLVTTGLATGREPSMTLVDRATDLADTALAAGFAPAAAEQEALLADFWATGDISVEGDPRLSATLRTNLFHLFASTGRDGTSSAAAKGLTGEGYEGHYFWDAEAFMLPVLAVLAPAVARAMLLYRAATLDAAIANARALDHQQGALYAWRTIEGREASAHYPSGSAQYHINAAIAFAIQCYVDATGDEAFLIDHGARMLVETARLWIALGDWADGSFHLRGVTGPDEYTALVDDNWYTNRMAQRHLRFAVEAVARVRQADPDALDDLAIGNAELDAFTRAADAMRLPYDNVRDLDAQDATFLDKPRWDVAGTPPHKRPLLLHYHPMTLYRHQVSKQADIVLGMVLAGTDIPIERKRRAFGHYEPITTHDSTLSASTFAILASEVGDETAAMRFLADAAFVDVDDQHGNTSHGVHMASLAGSWMAMTWGLAGFRPTGPRLAFRPSCPAAWEGYRFGLRWRGTLVRVAVTRETVTYHAVSGPGITIGHHDREVTLATGEKWQGPMGS